MAWRGGTGQRRSAANGPLPIRPVMEADFRRELAADRRRLPASGCAGGLPMADDVLTPASEDDANAFGVGVGGK